MSSYSLTQADIYIALYDEEQIEAMEQNSVTKSALRRIDDMQIAETYETDRKSLQVAYEAQQQAFQAELEAMREGRTHQTPNPIALAGIEFSDEKFALVERVEKALHNLWAGLESPDEQQRIRFLNFYNYLKNGKSEPLITQLPLLEIMEKAKRAGPKGRPRRPPNTPGAVSPNLRKHDAPLLIRMKKLCAGHATIRAASREVVRKSDGSINESDADRLENTYRAKMALRE